MSGTYIRAFNFLMKNEGGFVDDPSDNGGATKYGVSLNFLSSNFKKGSLWADVNKDGKIDKNDILALNTDIVKIIYREEFWKKVEKIPNDCLAIKVFDASVHIGPKNAIKMLQKILNVTQDGIIGKQTISALEKSNSHKILQRYIESLSLYYYTIAFNNKPKFDKFLKGWINRAKRLP